MADIIKIAAIYIKDGKLLMVKKYNQNFLGMLGGTLEEGETFLDCVEREIPEEIGVTDFKVIDTEAFYTAYSVAGSDVSKTLEMHCFKVQLNETPKPTYNPLDQSKVDAGYDISEVHWVGKNDLEIEYKNEKMICKLRSDLVDKDGNKINLTPITEEFIFPEFISKGLIF